MGSRRCLIEPGRPGLVLEMSRAERVSRVACNRKATGGGGGGLPCIRPADRYQRGLSAQSMGPRLLEACERTRAPEQGTGNPGKAGKCHDCGSVVDISAGTDGSCRPWMAPEMDPEKSRVA